MKKSQKMVHLILTVALTSACGIQRIKEHSSETKPDDQSTYLFDEPVEFACGPKELCNSKAHYCLKSQILSAGNWVLVSAKCHDIPASCNDAECIIAHGKSLWEGTRRCENGHLYTALNGKKSLTCRGFSS